MSSIAQNIQEILSKQNFAVVGASRSPDKFGHQVFFTLKRSGYITFPVNPHADVIDGEQVYPTLGSVPSPLDCIVCVVPPEITVDAIREASRLHVPYVWIQPGAESTEAVEEANSLGMRTVYGGPCIMVEIAIRND